MPMSQLQIKRVDGILKHLRFYMDMRSEHACRINPAMAPIYTDLSWQQIEALRDILLEQKGFGPDRFMVADILGSEDESKKRALFSPVDQNSIMKEIVTSADDEDAYTSKRTAGIMNINNIQSLYETLNPNLKGIVELIQTWIWWDLPDAADLHCLDQQIHRLGVLASHEIDAKIIEHYRGILNKPKGPITKVEILQHELQVLANIHGRMKVRLQHEKAFQVILARKDKHDNKTETLFRSGVDHMERLHQLDQSQDLSDELREHYAEIFSASPEKITIDMARQSERDAIANVKETLSKLLSSGENLGDAYNFKRKHLEDVEKRCKAVMAKFKKVLGSNAMPSSSSQPTDSQKEAAQT